MFNPETNLKPFSQEPHSSAFQLVASTLALTITICQAKFLTFFTGFKMGPSSVLYRFRRLESRVVDREVLLHFTEMNIKAATRTGNSHVEWDFYAFKFFVISIVDPGRVQSEWGFRVTKLAEQEPRFPVEI